MVVKDCKKSLTVSGAGEHDNTNVLLAVYTGKIDVNILYCSFLFKKKLIGP